MRDPSEAAVTVAGAAAAALAAVQAPVALRAAVRFLQSSALPEHEERAILAMLLTVMQSASLDALERGVEDPLPPASEAALAAVLGIPTGKAAT